MFRSKPIISEHGQSSRRLIAGNVLKQC